MDDSDRATAREEYLRAEAMAYRKPTPKPCGWCHQCSEAVGMGQAFCCPGCCTDYQIRQDAAKRNGEIFI